MERSGHDTGSKASSRRPGHTTTTTTTTNTSSTTSRAGRTSDSSSSKAHHDSNAQRSHAAARTNAQSQSHGPQVTHSPPFPLVNLKDVVSASQAAKGAPRPSGGSHQGRGGSQTQDGRDSSSSSSKAGARRDKSEQRRHGGATRSTSEDAGSNKKASKSSQPSADRSKPSSSKAQTPPSSSSSKADAESKSKNNNKSNSSNARAKNSEESQDTGKSGRNPGRLKKPLSAGGEAAGRDGPHGVQPQVSSSKSTPRAKKKISRGRTVHDASEFGEVKEMPDNDINRTLKQTSATHDVSRTLKQTSPTRDVGGSRSKEHTNNVQLKTTTATSATTTSTRTKTTTAAEVNQRTAQTAMQPLPSAPSISPPPPAAAKPSAFHMQLVPELSQQSSFFSLNKVPSRSSTSSDVQSEVCVDLPDYSELPSAQDGPPREREGGEDRRKLTLSFPSAPYKRLSGARRRGRGAACLSTMSTVLVLAVSLLLFLPVLLLVLVLVPLCLFFKWICSLCCCCGPLWGRCCIGCCHAHLTAPERLWVQRGADGGGGRLTPVAQCVIVLQRGLSTERLRHLLDARLLSLENRHGRRVYPRFTQRVEEFCCGYAWVPDHRFLLHNHVFNMPGYIESLEDLQVSRLGQ